MSISMVMPASAADADRRRRLRVMRSLALALLIFAAIVFVLTHGQDGFLGYVNAGAEASMVGAIADWFAVTALFRHPLGLPIPHTALIPRRKDELGRSLEEFVAENFLQEVIIRDRLAAAQVADRVAQWVAEPEHADRIVREGGSLVRAGLARIREEDLRTLAGDVLLPRLAQEPIAPIAGQLLAEVLRDDAHHGLVDLALDEGYHWLVHNQATFTEVLGERAPWWAPERLNELVTERVHLEAVRWVAEIRANPHHRARAALDSLLTQLAQDLLANPDTQERAERLKVRLLEHPQFLTSALAVVDSIRRALDDALQDPQGPLSTRARAELVRWAEQVRSDAALRARLDGWVADVVVGLIRRYGGELTTVITHTIQRWDGREAAQRIELHVGRDLQFIRINGTIVGGLVGVLIHALTQVL